jgi:predicted  nucleic acid-binding Zn-ribbon protein
MAKSKDPLANLQKQIEASKKRIASERDKLRGLVEDAQMILDNADRATEELEEARRSIERAADTLSEHL